MKLFISNINTNNHDHISEILGIVGLCGCMEHIDLGSGFIDLDVYQLESSEQQNMFQVITLLLGIGLDVSFKD